MVEISSTPLGLCCALAALFFILALSPIKQPFVVRSRIIDNPIQGPADGELKRGNARLAALPRHPLDPLTFTEIETVRTVLIEAGLVVLGEHQVHGVELYEPPKSSVLAWTKGNSLPTREAYVNTYRDGKIHEIIVDIEKKKVTKKGVFQGSGKPTMHMGDFQVAASAPLDYPPFLEAIAKRGLPVSRVLCLPLSGGWYNQSEDGNRRLARVSCYDNQSENFYMLPIEGITVWVDLDTKEIFGFFDEGVVPIPDPTVTGYTSNNIKDMDPPLKSISIEQPEGVNFKSDGYEFSWVNWNLHICPDPRAGLKISRVTFNDTVTKTVRDVMYQGFLSEMFVPYQDPSQSWFYRTYMDVGEYGFGQLSLGLVPLNDCPRNAHYLDGVLAGPDGEPYVVPNMVCVFERYAGDTAWRHTESLVPNGPMVAKPKVTLVVRQATAVGNYDYTVDWEFQMDGLIRTTVTMSGMVNVKGVKASTVEEWKNGEEYYGTMVNQHTVAVIHDHFINFRLDMDVDGAQNSFEEARLVARKLPEGSSWRKSVWDVVKTVPKTEKEAQYNASGLKPAEYFITNPSSKTRLGNTRSYKLVPRTSGIPLNTVDDYPQIRAAWTKNSIWVTPYDPDQLYAGGKFPNQAHGDDTLATWTEEGRSVEDTDLVLWYNIAYHHVPVQEDFPVMPSTLGGFDIKPANFFEANPAIKQRSFIAANLPSCSVSGIAI